MRKSKKIRPRRMFAPEENGYIWAEFTARTARGARTQWCDGVGSLPWSWHRWRKERPALRIIRVVVTAASPVVEAAAAESRQAEALRLAEEVRERILRVSTFRPSDNWDVALYEIAKTIDARLAKLGEGD